MNLFSFPGDSLNSSSDICRLLPRKLFTFTEMIFIILFNFDDGFTLQGVLQCTGLPQGTGGCDVSDKTLKELDVDIFPFELNNDEENDGNPHFGQIHEQLLFFSVSYMLAETPLHLL